MFKRKAEKIQKLLDCLSSSSIEPVPTAHAIIMSRTTHSMAKNKKATTAEDKHILLRRSSGEVLKHVERNGKEDLIVCIFGCRNTHTFFVILVFPVCLSFDSCTHIEVQK